MLIDFTVSNYLSFKEEQTFSFVSESRTEERNAIFNLENNTIKIYPFSIIYGPNASGKSNVISAIKDLCSFVKDSYKYKQDIDIPAYKPFLLDNEYNNKPSHFEIEYEINSIRYLYILDIQKNKVIKEELYRYSYKKRASKSTVFIREFGKDTYYGSSFSGAKKALETFLLPNQSLLSRWGNSNNDSLKSPYSFFSEQIEIYNSNIQTEIERIFDSCQTTLLILKKENFFKENILQFLRSADIQIEDLKVEQNKKSPILETLQRNPDLYENGNKEMIESLLSAEPKMAHNVHGSEEGKLLYFDLAKQESAGTNKMYVLSSYIFFSLVKGSVLIIDEFNNALHPLIQKNIIDMYIDPEINKTHAQLLVTSHDTFIMDSCKLKREQIWFTDKNDLGATELYCLNEFDKNLIRDYAVYGKYYIDGRFNALPKVSKLMVNREED